MGKLRLAISLVFLLALAPGCQVLYRYRPLPVLVRDAETKKPIEGADVHLSYPLSRDSLAPFDSSERTDKDGIAHLRAAPYYRGVIKAEVEMQDNVAAPPGQRCFRYEVVDGLVRNKGPAVLRRIYPSDYRARYADGTPLTGEMTLLKTGFRWLRGNGKEQYFFVGTQPEYDMQRRFAPDDNPANDASLARRRRPG
jgi:hypothetical protein